MKPPHLITRLTNGGNAQIKGMKVGQILTALDWDIGHIDLSDRTLTVPFVANIITPLRRFTLSLTGEPEQIYHYSFSKDEIPQMGITLQNRPHPPHIISSLTQNGVGERKGLRVGQTIQSVKLFTIYTNTYDIPIDVSDKPTTELTGLLRSKDGAILLLTGP